MEQNWFNALTFEAFKKYSFEWDHRKSQEENSRLFLEAVESYGYDVGRHQAKLWVLMTNCPACGALEVHNDFPTASQGPITDKYECGSEYYDDYIVYPCGHKPFELPKVNLKDPEIKALIARLRRY